MEGWETFCIQSQENWDLIGHVISHFLKTGHEHWHARGIHAQEQDLAWQAHPEQETPGTIAVAMSPPPEHAQFVHAPTAVKGTKLATPPALHSHVVQFPEML
jgi:hypothetical protein